MSGKKYQIVNGTSYGEQVPFEVVKILERYRENSHVLLRLYYGHPDTGQCWSETCDIIGHIGRSCGDVKIPLLVYPGQVGGDGILDDCVVRIDIRQGAGVKALYEHPRFRAFPNLRLEVTDTLHRPFKVLDEQGDFAAFFYKPEAKDFIALLNGAWPTAKQFKDMGDIYELD